VLAKKILTLKLELVYFGQAQALELKLDEFWDVYVHAFGKNDSILEFNIM
jgi:hypothetical protein